MQTYHVKACDYPADILAAGMAFELFHCLFVVSCTAFASFPPLSFIALPGVSFCFDRCGCVPFLCSCRMLRSLSRFSQSAKSPVRLQHHQSLSLSLQQMRSFSSEPFMESHKAAVSQISSQVKHFYDAQKPFRIVCSPFLRQSFPCTSAKSTGL